MVNHATMDEMVKITNYFNFGQRFAWITVCDDDGQRRGLRRRERYHAIEESRGCKQGEHARAEDVHVVMI